VGVFYYLHGGFMMKMLKRAVVKEELVALTGHHVSAVILNQILYWSERTADTDEYLREERRRSSEETSAAPSYGWIYKKSAELGEELMMDASESTIRNYLKKLVGMGFVEERRNPNHAWDKTLQYRPNLVAIQAGLMALGYTLEGYPVVIHSQDSNLKNCDSNLKNYASKRKNCDSKLKNCGALPEITTEITTEITVESTAPAKLEPAPSPSPKHFQGFNVMWQESIPIELAQRSVLIRKFVRNVTDVENISAAASLSLELGVTDDQIQQWFGAGGYWFTQSFGLRNGFPPYAKNILNELATAQAWSKTAPPVTVDTDVANFATEF